MYELVFCYFFFFQAEDGIRDLTVTGVQTCALPIYGAGCAEPLVVALDHDVRAERCRLQAHRPVDALEDQALQQRRAAPEIYRYHGAAGAVPGAFDSRPRAALRSRHAALSDRADRLERVSCGARRARTLQPRAARGAARGG